MSTATQKVFRTYELLEKILFQLPFHDLFIIQRVCQQWLSIISRSKTLRGEMFLTSQNQPLKPLNSPYNFSAGRTRAIYNPVPVKLNPAAEVVGLMNVRCPLATFGVSHQKLFLLFEIKGIPIYEKRIAHERASWRGMFITQPPIMAVNFDFVKREGHEGAVTVWRKEGVKWGDLHDWSVRLGEEYEIETGRDKDESFESLSFCLMHPSGGDGGMEEEAW